MEGLDKKINLNFKLLTGGTFSVTVNSDISVDLLKKIVSKKLKISKEKICLMNCERELQDGSLKDNGIINSSKIIVTPNVETGLAQRTENSTVMQALESLNDNQVNDFLSGKSPLNLSVRLGDHMMLIQLQLSTLSPSQQSSLKQKVANAALKQSLNKFSTNCEITNNGQAAVACQKMTIDNIDESANQKFRRLTPELQQEIKSPIKSLSSLASNLNNMDRPEKIWSSSVDPISANLTSCLCKRLNISCNNNCGQQPDGASNGLHRSNTMIPFHQRPATNSHMESQLSTVSKTNTPDSSSLELCDQHQELNLENPALAEASRSLTQTLRKLSKKVFTTKNRMVETSTVPNSSTQDSIENSSTFRYGSSGAIIESMKHHGKGIYSGTFSGTLNPSLQDKNGRPKRDISTIIHILNDLLSATPQNSRNGAKIFFEPTQPAVEFSGKIPKVKKQLSPKGSYSNIATQSSSQRCLYGQCNGHKKSDGTTSSNPKQLASSRMTDNCERCYQIINNQKLNMENMKTKTKLDQLKLVMKQKKERREARKLKLSPYNISPSREDQYNFNDVVPKQPFGDLENKKFVTNGMQRPDEEVSEATTAIVAAVTAKSTEIENHLEEVNTVA